MIPVSRIPRFSLKFSKLSLSLVAAYGGWKARVKTTSRRRAKVRKANVNVIMGGPSPASRPLIGATQRRQLPDRRRRTAQLASSIVERHARTHFFRRAAVRGNCVSGARDDATSAAIARGICLRACAISPLPLAARSARVPSAIATPTRFVIDVLPRDANLLSPRDRRRHRRRQGSLDWERRRGSFRLSISVHAHVRIGMHRTCVPDAAGIRRSRSYWPPNDSIIDDVIIVG